MKLYFRSYLRYKQLNSFFTGAVGGSVFTVYGSLSPSTFSIGGIILAFGLMAMAYGYHRWMSIKYFWRFSFFAELIMLAMITYYLLFSNHTTSALVVYAAYQLSFMLGGYLIRAESYFARHARLIGWIDVAKQQGYIAGLVFSYLFYKTLEYYLITDASEQVYNLHFLLAGFETLIIFSLIRSFRT